MEAKYKIIFLLFWVIFTLIRFYYARGYKKIEKVKTRDKKLEKFLVFLVALGSMIIPLVWVFSNFFKTFSINLLQGFRIFGIIIAILSLFLFYWVHKTLGKNWSPVLEIRKNHKLIKTGPYKRIRHPMYTQIWMWVIAQFFIASNWVVGLVGILTWSILYFLRVPREEKMMEEQFGEEYLKYKQETGEIFPRFGKPTERSNNA